MNKKSFDEIWFETFFIAVLIFICLVFLIILYNAFLVVPITISILTSILIIITVIAYIKYKI